MSTTSNKARQPKGIPVGGQFAASAKSESGIGLSDISTDVDEKKPALRHPMQVREDQAFLDAMEAAETEVCVRHLNKGDWAREFGDDEWGIVKSVGLHTLRTDTWSDTDTDEGDHVVATVPKDVGHALLAEHGALSNRVVNLYEKRKAAALETVDAYDAAYADQRRTLGYNSLRQSARDIWLSGVAAGIATEPEFDLMPSRDSIPEMQALEKAYVDYNTMISVGGHSDELGARLSTALRGAIQATDRQFAPNVRTLPLSQARLDSADFTANDLAELGDGETMEFHGAQTAHVSVTVERKPVTRGGEPVPGIGQGAYKVKNHLGGATTTIPFNNAVGNEGNAAKSAALAVHRLLSFDDRA